MKVVTAIMFIVLLASGGCAFSRATLGDDFSRADVAKVKKGETTRSEVIAMFGAPDRILPLNGRDMFQYYRYDAKSGSLLLILVNFARFNIKSDDFYVWFNDAGIVQEVLFGNRTDKLQFQFWPFGE